MREFQASDLSNCVQQLDGSAGQTGGRTGSGNHPGSGNTTVGGDGGGGDDDDSSDDGSSYRDDDLDSSDEEEEEEGAEGGKVKDLEWDNSTLAIQRGRIQGEYFILLADNKTYCKFKFTALFHIDVLYHISLL